MPSTKVNIEVVATEDWLRLINSAAALLGVTPVAFIRKASAEAAWRLVANQADSPLTVAQGAAFSRMLGRPLAQNAEIQNLLASRSPWDE